jgi:hypothetical protein
MSERKQVNMLVSKSKEPSLESVQIDEKGTIKVESINIDKICVKYYMIDAEILFSRTPFMNQTAQNFSYVKPYH